MGALKRAGIGLVIGGVLGALVAWVLLAILSAL